MKTRKQLNKKFDNPVKIHLVPPPTGEIASLVYKLAKQLPKCGLSILQQDFMAYIDSAYNLSKKERLEALQAVNYVNFNQ